MTTLHYYLMWSILSGAYLALGEVAEHKMQSWHSLQQVRFRPLLVGECQTAVTISSAELGEYKHALHLVAKKPPVERILDFTAPLGAEHAQVVQFVSWALEPTLYRVRQKIPL